MQRATQMRGLGDSANELSSEHKLKPATGDEADPEESNAAKKVSVSANDPKIGKTIWGHMETTMPDGELRDKPHGKAVTVPAHIHDKTCQTISNHVKSEAIPNRRRTYGSAVEQASTKPGPKPEIFLVLWLEEALRRLLQDRGWWWDGDDRG
eukprot:s2363_g6.t1